MKKTVFKRWIALILSSAIALTLFAACKNDSDDDDDDEVYSSSSSGSSSVVLPSSVGTNELTGLTFENANDWESSKWVFEDSEATYTYEEFADSKSDGSKEVKTYSYAYDSTNKIITLKLSKVSKTEGSKTYSYSSASEYKSLIQSEITEEAELNYEYDETLAEFNMPVVYSYTLSSTSLSLSPYFNGSLPTKVEFEYEDSDDSFALLLEDGEFEVYGSEKEKAIGFPTFSSNSFSINLYSWSSDDGYADKESTYTYLVGTAKGTYSVSGSGSSATVTLTFTALPSSNLTAASSISTNTAYVLSYATYNDSETFLRK